MVILYCFVFVSVFFILYLFVIIGKLKVETSYYLTESISTLLPLLPFNYYNFAKDNATVILIAQPI